MLNLFHKIVTASGIYSTFDVILQNLKKKCENEGQLGKLSWVLIKKYVSRYELFAGVLKKV